MATTSVQLVNRSRCFASWLCAGLAKDNVKRTGCILTSVVCRRNHNSVQPQSRSSRIFSAVCIQRLPLITKVKSDLEISYEQLQDQLELEHSSLSEDEVQWEEILQRKKKLKDDDDDENMTIGIFESERKEFEEEQEEEWKTFSPAHRYTEADELNNLKSLQRKLEETLVLLVKKQNDSATWEVPRAEVTDPSETLQQVASKSLSETCGTDLNVQFLGNAPIAVMKNYKNKGNKVFFYKVNYVTGHLRLSVEYSDHIWVTREEMRDFVHPEYYTTVKRFLF